MYTQRNYEYEAQEICLLVGSIYVLVHDVHGVATRVQKPVFVFSVFLSLGDDGLVAKDVSSRVK